MSSTSYGILDVLRTTRFKLDWFLLNSSWTGLGTPDQFPPDHFLLENPLELLGWFMQAEVFERVSPGTLAVESWLEVDLFSGIDVLESCTLQGGVLSRPHVDGVTQLLTSRPVPLLGSS